MRDTPALRKYIKLTTEKYSKQIGLKTPGIHWTEKESNEACFHSKHDPNPKFCAGISCHVHNTIFINMAQNINRKDIEMTIVHELVHLRFRLRDEDHGEAFYVRMGRILEGKRYPKK